MRPWMICVRLRAVADRRGFNVATVMRPWMIAVATVWDRGRKELQCGHGHATVDDRTRQPPPSYSSRLQCGHGHATVDDTEGLGQAQSKIMLQCGHGHATVDDGGGAAGDLPGRAASMWPRSCDRG